MSGVAVAGRTVRYLVGGRGIGKAVGMDAAGGHVSERFARLLALYRKPDGSGWGGRDLEIATGGAVTRSYFSNLKQGRIGDPGLSKLGAIAGAMGFPPGLWFGAGAGEDGAPDATVVAALGDPTLRAILEEAARLDAGDRDLVLRVVRGVSGQSSGRAREGVRVAIFAETLVEEWLNRRGYFTVRGAKAGLLEMDLLAVRPAAGGGVEARHYEVQASTGPISWMTPWTPQLRKRHGGIAAGNARARSEEELEECVRAWVEKKFRDGRVREARGRLWPGAEWGFGLVAGEVRHDTELEEIRSCGVEVLRLSGVLDELTQEGGDDGWPIKKTSSTAADIAALIGVDRKLRPGGGPGATVS